MERPTLLKIRYEQPFGFLFLIALSPMIVLVMALNRDVGVVFAAVLAGLAMLLHVGTPPLYHRLLLVWTVVVPLGISSRMVKVNGYGGDVTMLLYGWEEG